MSLPHMLIVSEEQYALEAYERLFQNYAAVETVFGYTNGLESLQREDCACAVVMVCCDLLGPKDRNLLQEAQRNQPQASRVVLVDSHLHAGQDYNAVHAIRHERNRTDARALQEVFLSALMEYRLSSLTSSMRGADRQQFD